MPKLTDIRPLPRDVNAAEGVNQRVRLLMENAPSGVQPQSMPETDSTWLTRLTKLLGAIDRLEKSLMGDAKQSVGINMDGKGTNSSESTAAKPTKDVVFLTSTSINLVEVIEMMDIMILSVSRRNEMFTTPKDVKEAPLEALYDLREKFEAVDEAWKEEENRKAAGERVDRTTTAAKLLQKVREVRKDAKSALDGSSTTGPRVVQPPTKKKGAPPLKSKPATPGNTWNPYSFYTDQPGAIATWISGGLDDVNEDVIYVVTSRDGMQRKIRVWTGKDGYVHSELLQILTPAATK